LEVHITMETNLIKINKFFKLKRLAQILAYVVIRYDAIRNPVLSTEIAKYYKISHKQVLGYINELDDLGYTMRPEERCPRPISPSKEGKEMYYEIISAFFSKKKQKLIKKHSLLE